MRNPYQVGGWLHGRMHYGRHRLIEYLLTTQEPLVWVIGMRRMGKTSLLRQIELLCCQDKDTDLIPLFWDLQGFKNIDEMNSELVMAVEVVADRFQQHGVGVDDLRGRSALDILRALQRALLNKNRRLLLLIDEAEAFINIAEEDDSYLQKLRKVLQNGRQRTVMTATRRLMEVNELSRNWVTSPFLFGVSATNLHRLDDSSARDLVNQTQSDHKMEIPPAIVGEIVEYTNRHPYLLQYLCHRLFRNVSINTGTLRRIQDEDLRPNPFLSQTLQVDYEHLSPTEQQILLTISRYGLMHEHVFQTELGHISTSQAERSLSRMEDLGYIRQMYGCWALGHEYLRNWVVEYYEDLSENVDSTVSYHGTDDRPMASQSVQQAELERELHSQQRRLGNLLSRRARHSGNVPNELSKEIQNARIDLDKTRNRLTRLRNAAGP